MSRRQLSSAVLPVVLPLEGRVVFDTTYYNLASGPLLQNWSNINQISANNDWSTVPSITGFRGDRIANAAAADPRTLTDDSIPPGGNPINVTANQTDPTTPTTLTAGGLFEFENPNSTNDPTVAFQGSSTADAPFLKIYLNTTGQTNVPVSYNLRDLDTTDTAVQQVVAQYRVGTSGNYTNIPVSYVADASADGSATLVTPVNFNLPADALGQAQVELRILTADATGSDAMIGVDDISVGGTAPNIFNFDPQSYSVNEGAGTISLTVTRGNPAVASSVGYFTANGTATAGSDYTAASGTLNFSVGVATQSFTIPILNDSVAETLEQFTISLTNASGGTIGTLGTATVSVIDNDTVAPTGLLLNEVSANPPGADTPNEYVELRGTAGQKLLNTYVLSVEGDATANAGAITAVLDLSSGTIGSNGLLIVKGANSTLTIDPATGVVQNTSFDTVAGGVLQNGVNSFLVVYSPNVFPSGDIDTNNDGTIDNLPSGATLLDGVGYLSNSTTAPGLAYGAVLPPLTSTSADIIPDAVTRLPNNTTPLSASAFYGGDLEGTDNTSLAYTTTAPDRLTANTPAGAVLTPGATNFGGGGGDTVPPTISGTSFLFNVAATPPSLAIAFSENVQASLTAGDLVLQNLTNNTTVPAANIVISGYNTTTNVATVTFTGYANGILPNGSYRLTIAAGAVTDAAGNALASPYTYDFFALAGDANRDRVVNFNDFLVLQNNFNTSGTFSQGDFNYNGVIDFNDFLILQNNFNATV